jgi:hypothetical protein
LPRRFSPRARLCRRPTRRAGGEPHRRFNVYRNNVYSSLIDVMQARFPVASLLVGDEFFRAMARVYIEREPPRSAVLLRYGESFPSFVAGFEPAGSVPYLADIAALEWAWHAAYHSADAAPLPLEELASVASQAGDAVFKLHPSLGLVSSTFPIVTIYELHADTSEPPQTKLEAQGEDALVLRPNLDVEIRRLPTGGDLYRSASRSTQPWRGFGGGVAECADFNLKPIFGAEGCGAIVGADDMTGGMPNKVLTK